MGPPAHVCVPQVSFLLQYYKRPWMIRPILDALRDGCSEVVTELLVNVDNPEEHRIWYGTEVRALPGEGLPVADVIV